MEADAERDGSGVPADDEARRLAVRRVVYALMLVPILVADVAYTTWYFDLSSRLALEPAAPVFLYGFAVTCIHGFLFALIVGDPEPDKNGPHPIRRADVWGGSAVLLVFWGVPVTWAFWLVGAF